MNEKHEVTGTKSITNRPSNPESTGGNPGLARTKASTEPN
jgi:hypothetical protein